MKRLVMKRCMMSACTHLSLQGGLQQFGMQFPFAWPPAVSIYAAHEAHAGLIASNGARQHGRVHHCKGAESTPAESQDDERRDAEAKALEAARYAKDLDMARKEAFAEKQRRRAGFLQEQVRHACPLCRSCCEPPCQCSAESRQ